MKRSLLILAGWTVVVATTARAQSPDELARTNAFIAALQNPDGGFAAKAGDRSTLPSTSSAIRVLKNTGGTIPDVLACVKYVASCRDAESGGFAPTPGGTPDVRTTAVGLMAVAELKVVSDEIDRGAIGYFSKNVKGFEDIRIAVAGLEAVGKPSPDFAAWTKQIEAMRNVDGTFGTGAIRARAIGGTNVALLRMGVKLPNRESVLAALRSGQLPDGGWSNGEKPSDLEATYRVMRAFHMLKETPDLDRLRAFLARCRHSDGGYSVQPGGDSDLGGTYFATTVGRWVKLLDGEPPLVETAGFIPLSAEGKGLEGWEGDTALWSARDGKIVGTSPGLRHNDFLATAKSYGDFVLKLTFRVIGSEQSNSGIQFRSVRVPGHEMSGYQADIGQGYWGCLYDESRRNKVLVKAAPGAVNAVRKSGWNTYDIRAMGDTIRLGLNGVKSVDYREEDAKIARDGRVALQIHAGGPMTVEFKDLWIQPLPSPTADRPSEPGFHLRTLKSEQGDRKYTVSLPPGYDGKTEFPVLLFLHGSGQRGEDGIVSAQVGLGPAVLNHPDAYRAIGVYPQARTTWAADSADARAALAALDDVLANYKADRKRVILTGLSMGGAGAWSLAAAHPERFAAVVPVCGHGRVESAKALKALPIWAFVGDADSDRTVLNTRAMIEAVRASGAAARETEYRGVGHNSWDRAYNDPDLIRWMLAQAR